MYAKARDAFICVFVFALDRSSASGLSSSWMERLAQTSVRALWVSPITRVPNCFMAIGSKETRAITDIYSLRKVKVKNAAKCN